MELSCHYLVIEITQHKRHLLTIVRRTNKHLFKAAHTPLNMLARRPQLEGEHCKNVTLSSDRIV